MRAWLFTGLVAAVGVVGPGTLAHAQTVADGVRNAPDGRIRMTFEARPGVCGHGSNIATGRNRGDDWEWECEPGPVRVVLTKRNGEVTRVRTFIGGRWRAATRTTELGRVSAVDAAEFLVGLAENVRGRVSREAIMPATLADSAVVWPALLRVARDDARPRQTRRAATQWIGMAAGDALVERAGPDVVDDPDRDARTQAVFAVSQLPKDQGIPILLDVARTHRDPEIRSKALFWLGQTGDPRALDLFEEVLRTAPPR